MNNDSTPAPDSPYRLVESAQSLGPCILSPLILAREQPDRIWSAGGRVDWRLKSHNVGRGEVDRGQYDAPRRVPWGSGCSLFAATSVIQRVGSMHEGYFLYLEDVDWCLQAARLGVPTYYVPSARIYHGISKSVGLLDPRVVTYYGWRNYYMLVGRHGNPMQKMYAAYDLVSRLVKTAVKLSLVPAARNDRDYAARTQALLDAIRGRVGRAPFPDGFAPGYGSGLASV